MKEPKKTGALFKLGLSESFDLELATENSQMQESEQTTNVNLSLGQHVNQYHIIKEIGRGGMGVVYKALDTKLNREVALKVIFVQNKKNIKQLLKEAKVVAQLNHPNIINLFEVCESPICFFTMELIDGISLDEFIQNHSNKVKNKEYFIKITKIFIAIAKALSSAHKKKIIHRDIKPENIMLDRNKGVVIMDFGLAKIERDDVSITAELAGTPIYMSPEQAENAKIKPSTDIYSLGATFYKAISTQTIFQGDTILNILYQIINDDPVRLRLLNPKIPKELEAICFKCIEKKPKKRYPSMNAFANDLNNYLEKKPILAKPPNKLSATIKLMKRNKWQTITAFSLLIFAVYVAEVKIDAYKRLRVDAYERLKKDLAYEKELVRQKSFESMKKDLALTLASINNNEINTANEYLKKAKKYYKESTFANPDNCVEINLLNNKMFLYQKKITVQSYQYMAKVKENFILMNKFNNDKGMPLYDFSLKENDKIKSKCSWIYSTSTTPNGKFIAILYKKNEQTYIAIHKSATLEQIFEFKINYELNNICYFYDNEKIIIFGKQKFKIFKLEFKKKKQKEVIERTIFGMVSSDLNTNSVTRWKDKIIYSNGNQIFSYDLKKDKTEGIFKTESASCICQYDKKSGKLIVASSKGKLYFIDPFKINKKKSPSTENHTSGIIKIKCQNNDIFTMSKAGEIFIWNNEKIIKRIYLPDDLVDFFVGGDFVFCLSESSLYLYKYKTPKFLREIKNVINAEKIHLRNDKVTIPVYKKVITYDLINNAREEIITPMFAVVRDCFINPDNQKLLHMTKTPKTVRYAKKEITRQFPENLRSSIYDKKKNLLYVYNRKMAVVVWDAKKEMISKTYFHPIDHSNYPNATLSPDRKKIVFAFEKNRNFTNCIWVLNLKSGKYKKIKLNYNSEKVNIKMYHKNSINWLVLSFDKNIQVWNFDDLEKGNKKPIIIFKHKNKINCFVIVQNKERLISMDTRNNMFIWNIGKHSFESSRLLLKFNTGHNILDCVYHESLQQLVTVGDKSLIWNFNKQ